MALEILDRLDAARVLGDDREWRLVPHHVDHDRRILRLGRGVLDDRVDVAEAGVIGARHDARHGRAGALALVDHDVEALLFEVAVVLGVEERGVRALRLPAQRELDGGVLGARRTGDQGQSQQRGAYFSQHRDLLKLHCLTVDEVSQVAMTLSLRVAQPVT
ncbi:orotate phosphoribosyltransferase-like protein [Bradyrhizobium elkanii]